MKVHRQAAAQGYAAQCSAQRSTERSAVPARMPVVSDLRGRGGRTPHTLSFAAGDVVVVSGLPGSGKTTLLRRAAAGLGIDSQDTRRAWEARMGPVPYVLYRPVVRVAHFLRTHWALRTGASLVVHDCGTHAWVRWSLARGAARGGRALHLVLLDVPPELALEGQRSRGRKVSAYAFARHRRAVPRLIDEVAAGRLPRGVASAVLLDRQAAQTVTRIAFGASPGQR
ncbi:AAA family ATPase [Streptomyces sp. NPDC020719]|uniref:AAA family ATPase n=1 Tax=Streptomyces sp. NPDC020719 TaxID=3154896 RepID=UPI0033C9261A